MNELQIFKNNVFGQVRVVEQNGEPWFVAKDVCDVFAVTNRNRLMQELDNDEKGYTQMDTPGGKQSIAIVNEAGLYQLLFSLQPNKAKARGIGEEEIQRRINRLKEFKRWITHEVIPSIRKTGGYDLNPVPIVKLHNGKVVATVRDVARFFNISVADIINDLKDSKYLIQSSAEYYLTRDGIFLTVNDPQKFKRYMNAFDEMERQITLIQQKPQQLQFQPKELISYMIEMRKVLKAANVSDDVIAKGFAEFSENQGVKLPKFFIEDKITEDMNIDKILEYGKKAKNPSYEDYVLTLSFPIKRSIEIKKK